MKKTLFFLFAIMALGFMGCDINPKPAANGKSDVDMVIIHQGQMQFYNHATQKLTPFEAETDSVVNIAFDNNNHLYYTAAHQQTLALKVINLSEANPQPALCANWQLTLDQITDLMFGTGASIIFMDDSMENLYMMKSSFDDDNPIGVEVFNIASGSTKGLTFEEYQPVNSPSYAKDHFYNEQGKLYYVTPEGKVCLTDKIDFTSVFEEGDLVDLFFYPNDISADGKQILYEADIEIGEGWGYYCVASSDGQQQKILDGSDSWTLAPKWLADGSLVYVGEEPRPESDPAYSDWNTTRHCIKIMDPQGLTSTLVSDAREFYVNPVGTPLNPKEKQASLEGCDMAVFDKGKVTFYNSTTDTFIPLVAESDYVVSGVFWEDGVFYYTVAIGDELYLKKIFLGPIKSEPDMVTDWELELKDCFSEKCGKAATMLSFSNFPLVGIESGVYEELCVFQGYQYYNLHTETKTDYWPTDFDASEEVAEEERLKEFLGLFDLGRFDLDIPSEVEENKLELYSIAPSHKCFAYAYYTDLGPTGGHGPLCFATLDGKVKMALEGTEVSDMYYGWLNNGRLAYSDSEGIKTVAPDGTITKISDGKMFVTVH